MVSRLLQSIAALIVSVISSAGYPGICLLMAIESACIPLPSEVIMPFSGYLVFAGRFKLLWVAVAGALGCNLGSAVAYYVGARGGRPLAEKYGRYVLVSRRDLDRADHWFARYGNATVFFARLLPVVRTFIALPAGVARMNFWQFNLYTFAGSLPWCWILAYAGLRLGANWQSLRTYFHRFDAVLGVALGAAVAWFVYTHWKDRLRGEQSGVGGLKPEATSRKAE
jgi:membrane protein DedA with SNARE-associated domain